MFWGRLIRSLVWATTRGRAHRGRERVQSRIQPEGWLFPPHQQAKTCGFAGSVVRETDSSGAVPLRGGAQRKARPGVV